jgi:DNA replication and repair protein RecF
VVGPHRDDVEVRLDGRALRTFGSQGQHRTAAIALKLGEAAILDEGGRGVVVLLDDILSELDERRGRGLVELVGELGQALMTSTKPPGELVRGGTCGCFRVEKGEVSRQ